MSLRQAIMAQSSLLSRRLGVGRRGSPKTKTLTSIRGSSSSTAVTIKEWPTAMVESNGDYRQEAWLEDHIGGPLYEHQKSLPRLPVPSIAETLERFLPTAMPLAKTPSEAAQLQQAVDKFATQAAPLQERLLQRQQADCADTSWLQHWWNTLGYLQVRDSVVINVSYFFDFADDPQAATSVQRGAALLAAVADYRRLVVSGTLPAEAIGKKKQTVLCSTAYKYMLHACRVPQLEQDSYRIYDPARFDHVVVARKGHLFVVEDWCDPVSHQARNLSVLEGALQECIDQADRLEASGSAASVMKLGWLTSSDRDSCAVARQAMLAAGGAAMEQALEKLESGAILLCLDDVDPVSRDACAPLWLYGGANDGAANRWFDKSIQLMVTNNGKAGLLGEHSMMDGMPVVGLADYCTKHLYREYASKSQSFDGGSAARVSPIFDEGLLQKLQSSNVPELVQKAKAQHLGWVGKHDMHAQSFQGYGGQFMKKAGHSPDAYAQIAMQLASYRLFGEQVGTYEATQVRPFLHGRTETTRTVSTESAAFLQKMGLRPKGDEEDEAAREEKLRLLSAATTAHVKYIGNAAKAQGVDRHFLGLSLLVGNGDQTPDLYADPVFARSKRWRVSTSNLTHPNFTNWGYGEVVPDGVGLSYSVHPRHCVFNVTSLKETGWSDKLCQLLEEALLEMRTLIELDQAKPSSRL